MMYISYQGQLSTNRSGLVGRGGRRSEVKEERRPQVDAGDMSGAAHPVLRGEHKQKLTPAKPAIQNAQQARP